MDKVIKELMENEKPFGLMSKEMQEKAALMEVVDFEWYSCNRGWCRQVSWGAIASDQHITYRLRPDYKEEPEEPEVVKCEVYASEKGYLHCRMGGGSNPMIHKAMANAHFIGFLYEDGVISSLPRMYKIDGLGKRNFFCTENDGGYEVLTPTHCLFRGK